MSISREGSGYESDTTPLEFDSNLKKKADLNIEKLRIEEKKIASNSSGFEKQKSMKKGQEFKNEIQT